MSTRATRILPPDTSIPTPASRFIPPVFLCVFLCVFSLPRWCISLTVSAPFCCLRTGGYTCQPMPSFIMLHSIQLIRCSTLVSAPKRIIDYVTTFPFFPFFFPLLFFPLPFSSLPLRSYLIWDSHRRKTLDVVCGRQYLQPFEWDFTNPNF